MCVQKQKQIFTFAYHREETQVPETGYILYQMLFVLLCFLCKPVAECINEINQCQAPVGVHAQVKCDAEKSHMDSEKNTATYIPEFRSTLRLHSGIHSQLKQARQGEEKIKSILHI